MRLIACIGALPVVVACGGGGGGGGDGGPDPDTGNTVVPSEVRSGTVAVLELEATNPGVAASGATVSISFTDLTAITVEPVFGTDPPDLGTCTVWIYQADEARPTVDEGPVSIADTLSPIGRCLFSGDEYRCPAAEGTVAEGQAFGAANAMGIASLGLGIDASPLDAIGMFVETSGYPNAAHNGLFPILGVNGDGSLSIAGVAPGTGAEVAGADQVEFAILAGEGPHPAQREFLDDGTTAITVQGEGGDVVPAFSVTTVTASGQGLTLDDESTQPHLLPGVAEALDFTCAGANGNCGVVGSGGSVTGFVLSGSTTDADHAGLPDTAFLPPEVAYAEFQCRGSLGGNSITLPAEAMTHILNSGATRIRTQLIRITAALGVAEMSTSVVVGHGLVGISDVTQ